MTHARTIRLSTPRIYVGDGSKLCLLINWEDFNYLLANNHATEDDSYPGVCYSKISAEDLEKILGAGICRRWRVGFPEIDSPLE